MTFRPYRRRVGSSLTPMGRGMLVGFASALVFWLLIIALTLYVIFD